MPGWREAIRHVGWVRERLKKGFDDLVEFWWGQGLAHHVPALAFYLVLSLAPLTLGLATIGSLLFNDQLQSGAAAQELSRFFPGDVQEQLREVTERTKSASSSLLVLSLFSMLWILSAALGVIERVMTQISGGEGFGFIYGRARLLVLSALLVALVVAIVSGSFLASGFGDKVATLLEIDAAPVRYTLAGLNVFLTASTLALIYRIVPRSKPSWGSAARASAPAAAILLATPYIVGRYFALGSHLSAVGLFLSMTIILTSCLLIANGLLLGAGLAARASRGGRAPSKS